MTDEAPSTVNVPYTDTTAELVKALLIERTQLVDGDADDLAWDVLHALQDAPSAAIIDWERKYQEKVTSDIKLNAVRRRKLAEAYEELNAANRTIAELQAQVRTLTPAYEQLTELRTKHTDHCNSTAKIIQELRQRIGRGQRGALDDTIIWLQERAQRLPATTPADIRDDLIDEVEGDELLTIDMALDAVARRGYQVVRAGGLSAPVPDGYRVVRAGD